MKTLVRTAVLGVFVLAVFAAVSTTVADPYPGQILKFSQKPMVKTEVGNPNEPNDYQVYYGHDELSTAYLDTTGTDPMKYTGVFMADDFCDRFDTPVVHVQWWGSYMDAQVGIEPPQVKQFLICFESDIPAGVAGPDGVTTRYSRPGEVLSSQIVNLIDDSSTPPPSGMFSEKQIRGPDPLLNEALYEYNAELAMPFEQQADEIYWLKIVALVDPNVNPNPDVPIRWGWHNRDYTIKDPLAGNPGETLTHISSVTGTQEIPVYHFQDDAVTGPVSVELLAATDEILVQQPYEEGLYHETYYISPYDGPPTIAEMSKDLAFNLYTVPEPSAILLLCVGFGCLIGRRTKR